MHEFTITFFQHILELVHIRAGKSFAGRHFQGFGIDLLTVHQNFVMQVGACGAAGRADIADDLPLLDAAAGFQATAETLQVRIGGVQVAAVANTDIVAVGAEGSHTLDRAITGGIDGCATGSSKIDALVHFV